MANPWHHAVSSSRKWGGIPQDYVDIHTWFDASKEHLADFRHRALRHHTQGIFECERTFGNTITLTTCARCGGDHFGPDAPEPDHEFVEKHIPVRWIGEQHVQEDLGCIPSLGDWLSRIAAEPWMNRSRKLSKELEEEPRKEEADERLDR